MNQDQNPGPGRPPIDDPADQHLHIRITRERKVAYVRAAKPNKLSEWAIQHLDRAANYKPPE